MAQFNVREEIQIHRDVEDVYQYLLDFRKWSEWSPWLICEQDCLLSFEDNAYSWEGKVVGSGAMSLTDTIVNQRMDYDLTFFKPWKSKAKVQLILTPSDSDNVTTVAWEMQSSLPWFLFFLKSMMMRMISMDYQRGLKMLKQKLETGSVDSALEYTQSEKIAGCHYAGIRTTCSMDEMPVQMDKDFKTLMELAPKLDKIEGEVGVPFTIYEKWKLGKGLVTYTCCVPIKEKLHNMAQFPELNISSFRPECDAFVVTHTGSYEHLGNAWSAAMMRAQNKVVAQNKKIMPFELYLTHPDDDGDLITKVCLPLK